MQEIKLGDFYGLFELEKFVIAKNYDLKMHGNGKIGENLVVIKDNKQKTGWSFLKVGEVIDGRQIYQCIYEA